MYDVELIDDGDFSFTYIDLNDAFDSILGYLGELKLGKLNDLINGAESLGFYTLKEKLEEVYNYVEHVEDMVAELDGTYEEAE